MKDRFIDIPEKIGADYKHFGMLLLNDDDGNKVTIIEIAKHWNPVDIAVEILHQWRRGKGRVPVTWRTLVKCLRDVGLNVLADNIDQSLLKRNRDKDSDTVHSEF